MDRIESRGIAIMIKNLRVCQEDSKPNGEQRAQEYLQETYRGFLPV